MSFSCSSRTSSSSSSQTTDRSSVISDTRRASVEDRDGGACVLCGVHTIDVAHIVVDAEDVSHGDMPCELLTLTIFKGILDPGSFPYAI